MQQGGNEWFKAQIEAKWGPGQQQWVVARVKSQLWSWSPRINDSDPIDSDPIDSMTPTPLIPTPLILGFQFRICAPIIRSLLVPRKNCLNIGNGFIRHCKMVMSIEAKIDYDPSYAKSYWLMSVKTKVSMAKLIF